jgi:DNA-binding transcriptional LysR family regulator
MLANASAILEILPARLAAFMQAHPRIRVDLEERMSPEIAGALLEGRADVGVVDVLTPSHGLEFLPFFRDDLALVVPRDHALASASQLRLVDLVEHNFIVLAGANAVTTRLFNAAAALGESIKVSLAMRSFDAACRMVAAGLGVTVLPKQAIQPQLQHLSLCAVPLAEDWAARTHFLALRSEAPAVARTLVDALREDQAFVSRAS